MVAAGGQKGSLVDQIGQVGAGKAGGTAGQDFQIDVRPNWNAAGMDFKNPFAAFNIRQVHYHLPVETAGPQKRGVQNVRPVGGGHYDYPFIRFKAIHFHQQLV